MTLQGWMVHCCHNPRWKNLYFLDLHGARCTHVFCAPGWLIVMVILQSSWLTRQLSRLQTSKRIPFISNCSQSSRRYLPMTSAWFSGTTTQQQRIVADSRKSSATLAPASWITIRHGSCLTAPQTGCQFWAPGSGGRTSIGIHGSLTAIVVGKSSIILSQTIDPSLNQFGFTEVPRLLPTRIIGWSSPIPLCFHSPRLEGRPHHDLIPTSWFKMHH